MPGVPRGLAEHHLRVDSAAKPVKEHLRRSAVQKRKAIGEEVARLLATGFIREIYHSEWLANVVMVPKKDKSLRMCIDFKHINRACPKDHFPLPRIDQIVDSTGGVREIVFFRRLFRLPSDPFVWTRRDSKQLSSLHSGASAMSPCHSASRMPEPRS